MQMSYLVELGSKRMRLPSCISESVLGESSAMIDGLWTANQNMKNPWSALGEYLIM